MSEEIEFEPTVENANLLAEAVVLSGKTKEDIINEILDEHLADYLEEKKGNR